MRFSLLLVLGFAPPVWISFIIVSRDDDMVCWSELITGEGLLRKPSQRKPRKLFLLSKKDEECWGVEGGC